MTGHGRPPLELEELWTAFEKVARADEAFYSRRYYPEEESGLNKKTAEFIGYFFLQTST